MASRYPVVPFMAPFSAWMEWADFGMKLTETMLASSSVITRRSEILSHAASSPLTADQREIMKMSTEKTRAFSQALMQLAMGGVTAMTAAQTAWMRGGASAMQRSLFASGTNPRLAQRILAPIRTAATGNAKRLSRARKSAR